MLMNECLEEWSFAIGVVGFALGHVVVVVVVVAAVVASASLAEACSTLIGVRVALELPLLFVARLRASTRQFSG